MSLAMCAPSFAIGINLLLHLPYVLESSQNLIVIQHGFSDYDFISYRHQKMLEYSGLPIKSEV
jgi:hypothetical protein